MLKTGIKYIRNWLEKKIEVYFLIVNGNNKANIFFIFSLCNFFNLNKNDVFEIKEEINFNH